MADWVDECLEVFKVGVFEKLTGGDLHVVVCLIV